MQLGNYSVAQASFRGAPHTVAAIKRAALESQGHIRVRLLAEEIISGLESKDALSEVLAIYYWVLTNTRYANDPRTVELVRAPYIVVDEIARGKVPSLDCDDIVALVAALLLSIGREVQVVTVAFMHAFYRGQRQYTHVILRVKEPRTRAWIVLDPVAAMQSRQMLGRVVAAKIYPIA